MKRFLFILLAMSVHCYSQEIKSVNFLQDGEVSKIVIETTKPVLAERFHVKDDKQIILDLKDVKADKKTLRAIDTSEFNGSTVYISGYKKPGTTNDVRFAIQLRDNVRSLLDQQGSKIILNVENRFGVFSKTKLDKAQNQKIVLKEEDAKLNVPRSYAIEDILENLTLSGPKKYIGKRISINVKDIPVPDILSMIADTSGFNIIIDEQVAKTPNLTLTLTNTPWDQALDTIMTLNKLVASKNANILVIKTLEQATKDLEELAKAEKSKLGLEPLVTKIFPISYADIKPLEKIIKDYLTEKRGTTQIDERTNSLIVRDTVDTIEKVKKVIDYLDTQTPQILIESKIVEANESYSKRIGLSRGLTFGYDPIRTDYDDPTGSFSFSSAPTTDEPTVLGFSINAFKRLANLDFTLQLMEAESKGRIISTPKVVTQNKKAAEIVNTETTSFLVTTIQDNNLITSFQQISAILSLKVTPHVTNEGSISMEVDVQKSGFGTRPSANSPPDQTTRNVKTNVLVDNGNTVVIGGLYTMQNLETESGVPFLKDLPLVGWLFRTPYAPESSKNELIIFLTPRIINQEQAGLVESGNVITNS